MTILSCLLWDGAQCCRTSRLAGCTVTGAISSRAVEYQSHRIRKGRFKVRLQGSGDMADTWHALQLNPWIESSVPHWEVCRAVTVVLTTTHTPKTGLVGMKLFIGLTL